MGVVVQWCLLSLLWLSSKVVVVNVVVVTVVVRVVDCGGRSWSVCGSECGLLVGAGADWHLDTRRYIHACSAEVGETGPPRDGRTEV